MQFKINAGRFLEVVEPSVLVSTKYCEREFSQINLISLNATLDVLKIEGYGGYFAVQTTASNDKIDNLGYACTEEGIVTTDADRLSQVLSSFDAYSLLNVNFAKNKLKISLEDDKTVFQTMVTSIQQVELPNIVSQGKNEIQCNRELFIKGIQKVNFAIGFEDSKPYYQCVAVQTDKNSCRFVAGSGSRFIAYNVSGKHIMTVPEKIELIFSKETALNIPALLKNWTSDDVYIEKHEKTPYYISIKNNIHYVAVLKLDSSGNAYADIDSVINIPREFSFTTEINDWAKALKGVSATYDEDMKRQAIIHNTIVRPDKHYCIIETDTPNSAHRKAKMTTINKDIPSFQCNTPFLNEVVKNATAGTDIEININNPDNGKFKPVLIKFPQVVQKDNDIVEDTIIFFVVNNV